MYDHVALVVKFSDGRVVLFEALRETGVGICDWDKFINKKWNEMYSKVIYRKLYAERTEEFTNENRRLY
jgi:hypothetical protein